MWPDSVELEINRPCQTLVASGYLKMLEGNVGLPDAHSPVDLKCTCSEIGELPCISRLQEREI